MPSARILLKWLINLVAFASAGAAILAQGGRWSGLLDIFTHFAPLYLVAGIGLLIGAIFLRPGRRRLALSGLGACAAVSAMALILPEYIRPTSPPAQAGLPGQIKVIQFNANGMPEGAEVAIGWIARENPDVVVVVQGSPRLLRGIREHVPLQLVCGLSCEVAILARARTSQAFNAPPGTPANLALYDYRDPRGGFTVIGVHHTWPTDLGLHQRNSEDLAVAAQRHRRDRLIVVGDFNSTPWSFSRAREEAALGLERRTRGVFTWPASTPFLPLDHVYAGHGWRTVEVRRGPDIGSDHYPVVAILAPRR